MPLTLSIPLHVGAPAVHPDGKEASRRVVPVLVPKPRHSHTLRRDLLPVQEKYLPPIKSAYSRRPARAFCHLWCGSAVRQPPLSPSHPSLVFVAAPLGSRCQSSQMSAVGVRGQSGLDHNTQNIIIQMIFAKASKQNSLLHLNCNSRGTELNVTISPCVGRFFAYPSSLTDSGPTALLVDTLAATLCSVTNMGAIDL